MPDEDLDKLLSDKMAELDEPDLQSIQATTQQQTQQAMGVPRKGETFEQRNYSGLPIDVTSGAPGLVRLGLSARDTEEDQMEYLSGIYGPNSARRADTGEWIVKTQDEAGKPKELLINEQGFSGRDLMSMMAYAPETVGAILAMRAGRVMPSTGKLRGLKGFGRDVAAEAIGQEAGGALKDVGVRLLDERPGIDAGEIAERRIENLPFDMAMSAGLGAAGKVISKVRTPIGPATAIADVEGREGAQALAKETGVEIPMSIGEKTGSQVFKRIEATASQLPGSSKYYSELQEQKTGALRRIINRLMGLPDDVAPGEVIPNAEDIGTAAVSHIRSRLTPMQEAVEASRNQAVREANQKVLDELADATGAKRQMYPEKVGASIRQKVFDEREAFRELNRQNYGAIPGATDRIHITPDLAGESRKILEALPKAGDAPSKMIPDNVVGYLRELADNPTQPRSLSDLQAMRSEIDNEIAAGEAIPGKQTKLLSQIRGELTKSINTVVTGNPKMKAAYDHANKVYADNVGKFKDKYVARLFRDIQEGGGFINDEDIVRKIGPTEFQSYKKILGARSKEFKALKRAIVDELYNDSLLPGEQLVNGDALIKNLSKFYKTNRSVAEEVLGTKGSELQRIGEVLSAVDSKIDAAKLSAALRSVDLGEQLSKTLQKLVKEQKVLDDAYRSKILRDIGENNLGADFDAGEFFNRFFGTSSKEELKSVMAQLADNPEIIEKLRRKAIERIMFGAQRSAKASDPSALGRGDPFLPPNSQTLKAALGDLDKHERMQIILGKKAYDSILNLAKVVRSSEVNEQAFRSAGGIGAGMQIGELFRGGVLGYTSNYVKQKVAAIVLASPKLRDWAANGVMQTPFEIRGRRLAETKQGALMTTLIGSTPFLQAASEEFGQGTAVNEFLTAIRRSINMFEADQSRKTEDSDEQLLEQKIFEIK